MCLYLPYLHFDTYALFVKRRALVRRRLRQGRPKPTPRRIAGLKSLEFRTIWQFLGHDPPFNCRRTLDQFGYPGLLNTSSRDDDQMMYKMTKQRILDPVRFILETQDEFQQANEKSATESKESGDNDDDNYHEESDVDVLDGNMLMVDQLWLWVLDDGM